MFTKYGWNTNPYNPETNSYDPPGTPTPPAWEQYLQQTGQTDLIRSAMPPPPPRESSATSVLARQAVTPFVANCEDGTMNICPNNTTYNVTYQQYTEIVRLGLENQRLPRNERLSQDQIAEKTGISGKWFVSQVLQYANVMFVGRNNR
jgi:hypothetical protein